jgi:hypothetical protein
MSRHTQCLVVSCPYCGDPAVLTSSTEVYQGRDFGLIWLCRPCQAWVGVHRNSPKAAPLGRLANLSLRRAKMKAHAAFDPLWKADKAFGSRRQAYEWLSDAMGLPYSQTHIGMFDESQCAVVVEVCHARARGLDGYIAEREVK